MRTTIGSLSNTSKKQAVTGVVRRKISSGAFYCHRSKQDGSELFRFGISTPKIVLDRQTERPCLSYIPVRDVFSVRMMKDRDGEGYVLDLPERSEVHRFYLKRRENLLLQAENVLLETIGKNLATIGRVQNGLNPFKEILLSLMDLQEIPKKDLFRRYPRKKRERMELYLSFLSDLDYIVIEEDRIVPGDQLIKFDISEEGWDTQELIVSILGDLINRGREYITQNLSIYMLEPYLSLASTMYLHSFLADKHIRMSLEDIGTYIKNTYPRACLNVDYHLNSYLLEMKGAGIVDSDGRYYVGKDDIFNEFKAKFADIASY